MVKKAARSPGKKEFFLGEIILQTKYYSQQPRRTNLRTRMPDMDPEQDWKYYRLRYEQASNFEYSTEASTFVEFGH